MSLHDLPTHALGLWQEAVVFGVLFIIGLFALAFDLVNREARQDAEHRASWLPRTDPEAASRLRNER